MSPSHGRDNGSTDRGSAVVDFVLVGTLVTLIFIALVQLAVVLHVRNTLIDCAGALITQDLSGRYAGDVESGQEVVEGLDTVVVRVRAPLPVIGLFGAGRVLIVSGHAVSERVVR
jgi:hypothetical protein